MKTYEEMTQTILHRIDEEKIPRWKAILLLILKYTVTLLLIVLFITIIFFFLKNLHPFKPWCLID